MWLWKCIIFWYTDMSPENQGDSRRCRIVQRLCVRWKYSAFLQLVQHVQSTLGEHFSLPKPGCLAPTLYHHPARLSGLQPIVKMHNPITISETSTEKQRHCPSPLETSRKQIIFCIIYSTINYLHLFLGDATSQKRPSLVRQWPWRVVRKPMGWPSGA